MMRKYWTVIKLKGWGNKWHNEMIDGQGRDVMRLHCDDVWLDDDMILNWWLLAGVRDEDYLMKTGGKVQTGK